MVISVTNLQEAYAKALLLDRDALAAAQRQGDVIGAHAIMQDAFATDVRPLCAKVRESRGAAADPLAALAGSGYVQRAAQARRAWTNRRSQIRSSTSKDQSSLPVPTGPSDRC